MDDLKESLLDLGWDSRTADLILELQGEERVKELRKKRALQLEKIHIEQRKIDRLDKLIRKEERNDQERRIATGK